jgi:hypothetical protein
LLFIVLFVVVVSLDKLLRRKEKKRKGILGICCLCRSTKSVGKYIRGLQATYDDRFVDHWKSLLSRIRADPTLQTLEGEKRRVGG